MRIDFYFNGGESGPRLTGSVRLVDGRAVAQDEGTARLIEEWAVVEPGNPGRGLTPEDGFEYMRAIPFNLRSGYSWAEWNHEGLDDEALGELFARIRRPASTSTVVGSLPVLFFGDYLSSRAVTVALNPSDREYLDKEGSLLTGSRQRFATLGTYELQAREHLHDAHCLDAISWMRAYFLPGRPVYRYFSHLDRFLSGAGFSFEQGTAAHLDLIQESTRPVWRDLPGDERTQLLQDDLPFLGMQLAARPLEAVFCNGRFVSDALKTGFHVRESGSGTFGKLRWWSGAIELASRRVPAAGWNYPLNQPTGLNADREREFGTYIADALRRGG